MTKDAEHPVNSGPDRPAYSGRLAAAGPGPGAAHGDARTRANAALWSAEAVHRSANLAQLIDAIDVLCQKFPPGAALPGMPAGTLRNRTDGLARAYAQLARDGGSDEPVPCGALLREVASGLITLFGARATGAVSLELSMTALSLPPDKRRAMVLIASELVVNALKHAFPDDRGGTIAVRLTSGDGWTEMTVADDGIGLRAADPMPGHGLGRGLIGGLTYLLGGTLAPVPAARGFAIALTFPEH